MTCRFFTLIISVFYCGSFFAQSDNDNIIITNRKEVYAFNISKTGNVFIEEEIETNYECTQRSTFITVVEMYDDQSNIDKLNIKGKKSNPQYNLYTSDDLFYTDAKVCHFKLFFDKKGEIAQVKVKKTYKDPRYFTKIHFSESLFTKEKNVTIIVPDWMNVELNERNFGNNITKEIQVDKTNRTHIYTYKITDEKPTKTEGNMQGYTHIYPHILVLAKSSTIEGKTTTYFEKLDDLYAWYAKVIETVNNDESIIKAKAKEITKGCTTELEKAKALFAWVQGNIRYIAFVDGIAGFKPDDAQEVLRKKYGDCKGMSNLLKSLLVAEGFDAHLSWIGTNHIAYDYSTPSLATDNHMICTLFLDEQTYYLDPTVKYMPLGEYPQTIQGRQTLVEDKDRSKYLLKRIPVFNPVMNSDSLSCDYTIEDGAIRAKAKQYYMGEAKQVLLSLIESTPKNKQEAALKSFLESHNRQDVASNIMMEGAISQSNAIVISYDLEYNSGIQSFEKEIFLTLDGDKEFMNANIDIEKRETDFLFNYKYHTVKNINLKIPGGYTVSYIPDNLNIEKDGYEITLNYLHKENIITYRKEITIKDPLIKKEYFSEWNTAIAALKKAYMEQIILTPQ